MDNSWRRFYISTNMIQFKAIDYEEYYIDIKTECFSFLHTMIFREGKDIGLFITPQSFIITFSHSLSPTTLGTFP